MRHLLLFSGGKDSMATALLLKERGVPAEHVFNDTGNEHSLTMGYIWEMAATVLGNLTILRSRTYESFDDLVVKRKMVPGKKTRFCTEELKVYPLWDYLATIEDDITVYQGIRAAESQPRSLMAPVEDVPEGEKDGHWHPHYTIVRPIFDWSAEETFAIHRRHNVPPNPLYTMGMGRVGCWPCIFVNHRELRAALKLDPGLLPRLRRLEALASESGGNPDSPRTVFRSDYIPQRYCTIPVITKDARTVMVPTVDDVARYLLSVDEDQLPLLPPSRCLSIYNLCE